ncbi:hypothetical protein JANAI61_14510 [Jannaschia sp. AI_61]|nr:hypothetical protein JANAI61_14510 [Jannaschia sp. AI_61]
MDDGLPVLTQRLADWAIKQGYHGLRVNSFAPDAAPDGMNIVLYRWQAGRTITLCDTQGLLGAKTLPTT